VLARQSDRRAPFHVEHPREHGSDPALFHVELRAVLTSDSVEVDDSSRVPIGLQFHVACRNRWNST